MVGDACAGTVLNVLGEHARERGEVPAILAPGRSPLTYAMLYAQVMRVGEIISRLGLGDNPRIAIVAPNGPEVASAILAVSSWAACSPLDPGLTIAECESLLAQMRVNALIAPGDYDGAAVVAASRMGTLVVRMHPRPEGPAGAFDLHPGFDAVAVAGARRQFRDIALLLSTSGTTGRPNVVPSSHAQMLARVVRHPVAESDRCVCLSPLFTASALANSLFGPVAAGGSLVAPSDVDVETIAGCLNEFRPTYFSASPTMHKAILSAVDDQKLKVPGSLRFIRSNGSALPAALQCELERAFGVPIVQGYGMTETGVIAQSPLPPAQRKPGSVGLVRGVEVIIVSGSGESLPANAAGEVLVRGPGVIDGYDDDPDANLSAFRDGWFLSGDLGYFDDDGYLVLTGRIKELINRGGLKVAPGEIDRILLSHPAVEEAAAFPIPHPTLGEDVGAAVVLRDSRAVSEQALREFVGEHLPRNKVPARIAFVSALPKNALGKVRRGELAPLMTTPPSARHNTAPRDQIELHLMKLWEEVLQKTDMGIDDNFFALGGDSLMAARLVARIEHHFGRALPLDAFWFGAPTVARLADLLREDEETRAWPMLVPIKAHGKKSPLFCVHTQGGNLFHYYPLAMGLDEEQPVFGLQARGVYGGADPRRSIEEIADDCIATMRTIQRHGPYRIAAYSSAGMIALEMSRQLLAQGERVSVLALIDAGVRHGRRIRSAVPRIKNRMLRLRQVGVRLIQERAYHWFLTATRQQRLRRFRTVGEAQRWALWSYRPAIYPGTAHLLIADKSVAEAGGDRTLGWDRLINGRLLVHQFSADHASLMKRPVVDEVADLLQRALDANGMV